MTTGVLAELFGPDGLIVVAVIVIVLLFGGSQLPKLARGLGSASHEFKKGLEDGDPKVSTDAKAGDETKSSGANPSS